MKSCSGTHHKLVPWCCPVWTGPWPEVPGSGAGEGQSGQFPQSKPLFYKDESLNHAANLKGFDFYLGARGRYRGQGHHIKVRFQMKRFQCWGRWVIPQLVPHGLGTGRRGWKKFKFLLPLAAYSCLRWCTHIYWGDFFRGRSFLSWMEI